MTGDGIIATPIRAGACGWSVSAAIPLVFKAGHGATTGGASGWIVDAARILLPMIAIPDAIVAATAIMAAAAAVVTCSRSIANPATCGVTGAAKGSTVPSGLSASAATRLASAGVRGDKIG